MASKKVPIILKLWGADFGTAQKEFERMAVNYMGLKAGLFAIDLDKNRYINRNIQWLWSQYQKGFPYGKAHA